MDNSNSIRVTKNDAGNVVYRLVSDHETVWKAVVKDDPESRTWAETKAAVAMKNRSDSEKDK